MMMLPMLETYLLMLSCDAPLMMLEGLINNNNSGVPCERDLHLARELGDHGNSLMDRCDLSLGDVLTHQLSYDIVDVFLHDSYSNLIHVDSSGRGIDVNDDSLEEFGSFHFKEVVAPKEPNHDRLVPESFGNDHGHRERKTTVETVLPREENHNIVMVENCEKIHGHSMGAHLHLHELSKGSSMNMASQRVMFMGESSKSTIGEDVREGHALIDIPLPSNASSKDKGKGFDSQSFNFISPNVQGHINGDKEVFSTLMSGSKNKEGSLVTPNCWDLSKPMDLLFGEKGIQNGVWYFKNMDITPTETINDKCQVKIKHELVKSCFEKVGKLSLGLFPRTQTKMDVYERDVTKDVEAEK
ncbi:uncharacterized protein LOC18425591 isoform X1 [Amborella trichopoda]|uniref:uncharacterized protein LOC18425591 isoform X1 n=1 Tax=Amborella trichopoda TaxID=13333 RepID=UPI0009C0D8E0|nr:uncharacterized protein LOC18425591 isoform X1 [Amborella trichopoda]|eukprot:XP_020517749.1 uncharacterized protein LOC18425591 isoform X1 [Amborella trichopoda]